MNEKEKENKDLRDLSGILKDDYIDKGFDSISEIPNTSFDRKNISFSMINDQSIDCNSNFNIS